MLGYLKGHVMQTLGMYPLDRELPSAGKHFSILHGSRGQGRKAEILLSPFPLERPTARRCESKPLKWGQCKSWWECVVCEQRMTSVIPQIFLFFAFFFFFSLLYFLQSLYHLKLSLAFVFLMMFPLALLIILFSLWMSDYFQKIRSDWLFVENKTRKHNWIYSQKTVWVI